MAATPVCAFSFPPASPSAAGEGQDSLCPLCAGHSRARDGWGWLSSCPGRPPHPHGLLYHELARVGQHGQLDGQ